jgi:hypothetical protein
MAMAAAIDIARPVWRVATHDSKLTVRRLVTTFVPTTSRNWRNDPKSTARTSMSHGLLTDLDAEGGPLVPPPG